MMVDPRYPSIAEPPAGPDVIAQSELVVCGTCANTGRWFETSQTPSGQEIVTRYTDCPHCGRRGLAGIHRTVEEEMADRELDMYERAMWRDR